MERRGPDADELLHRGNQFVDRRGRRHEHRRGNQRRNRRRIGLSDLSVGGVFDLSASILSYDYTGTNYPNAVGVTDAGDNVSSDATPARSTIITTTRLNTESRSEFGLSPANTIIGGTSFGSYMLTLEIPTNSPAADFVYGVPGSTFPLTDEVLQSRQTPTSAGAYEANPISNYNLNTNLPANLILSTLPAIILTGAGRTVAFTNAVDSQVYSNPGYQWQLNGNNISNNVNYSGTTSNILTIKKVTLADEEEIYRP